MDGNSKWTVAGVVVALLALGFGWYAWRNPRAPRRTGITTEARNSDGTPCRDAVVTGPNGEEVGCVGPEALACLPEAWLGRLIEVRAPGGRRSGRTPFLVPEDGSRPVLVVPGSPDRSADGSNG